MKTANTTPRPATVTSPPLCASSEGAPAVVTLTVPADDVAEVELVFAVEDAVVFPVADAAPLAAVPLEALPVAEPDVEALVEALVAEPVALVSVAVAFPAFELEEDCHVVSIRLSG
jgi:hypothetical protein